MLEISNLTVDHIAQPMGVGASPSFGWILQNGRRDVLQAAFRFELSDAEEFQTLLFDSGRIASGCSANYRPQDLSLASAKRYFWRVRVWTAEGDKSLSATATFATALLDNGEWHARFVTAESASDAESSKGTCVQTIFSVKGKVKSAYAFATALGVYHLFVNEEKAGEDQLAPGWTSYHKHLLYQTYDITGLLREGENVLCGWLGAGWYKGLMGFLHKRNNYGDRTAFLCQVEIAYEDGTRQTVATDETWRGGDLPVLFSEIYDGEIYDARVEPKADRPVERIPFDFRALSPQSGCRVRIMDTLPVREILTTPKGETVLDFGQNLTGWVRFRASGKPGEVVCLQCFEALDAEGNVYTANLRAAKQTIRYTLRGGASETYQPLFTFQGFRYARVISYPGTVEKDAFAACAVHSQMEQTGEFECSHPLLNQLQHNILWSLKGNFLDLPTDCPQRDERMGWTGDAQIFSPTACFLVNAYPFFRKWLKDLACDQTPEGGVPHVVPDILTGVPEVAENWLLSMGTHSAAAWSDAAVIIPWNLYLAYGDDQILRDQYGSMKAWIDFMRSHSDGHRWAYRLQFGDWVALDAEEGSYFGATPNEFTCSAYYAYSTGLFAKIAAILGRKEDARVYGQLRDDICRSFQQAYFSQEGELLIKTQTAHVLALQFNLTPPPFQEKTVNALAALIEKENGHLVTGFVGTPYIAHALSRYGKLAEAYDLVLKEDFPSWLYQVKRGATTIWEHWDGIKPDGSMWSADMNSFNHYAYGAIGDWLYRTVAGICLDETSPGGRHTVIRPRIGGGLTDAKACYQSAYGPVRVRWQRQGDKVNLRVQVPCNATADIVLDASEILESDRLAFSGEPRPMRATAGSGTYDITYRLG